MTHKFACWHGPNYDLYYWEIPCPLFGFSQEITLARMPRVLFISTEYWKQCSVKQPDAKEIEIYSDSLTLFSTVVNKLMHRLWLKVLRMLHLMLIFCLKYIPSETLVCSGGETNLGLFVDCQLWEQQKKSLKKLCPEANTQTQTKSICFLLWVIGGWLAVRVTVLCPCNYRTIVISITE